MDRQGEWDQKAFADLNLIVQDKTAPALLTGEIFESRLGLPGSIIVEVGLLRAAPKMATIEALASFSCRETFK